jgi:hypothetical protein
VKGNKMDLSQRLVVSTKHKVCENGSDSVIRRKKEIKDIHSVAAICLRSFILPNFNPIDLSDYTRIPSFLVYLIT